jgi:hypothetical protein
MNAAGVYARVSALLADYLHPFGLSASAGPLRAVAELTCGMIWTGSVQLSNAARLFARTAGELEHAVKRLSAHLGDPRWDHREWAAAVLAEQARHVREDDLIPLDATELAKPYARRMQYQCTVRDASRPGDPLVTGYWCWGAYHWSPRRHTLSALMLRPYSPRQPRYLSENDLILRWMWRLREATSGRGIWLIDRGADRPEILSGLLQVQKRWIVRLREDRALIGPDGTRGSTGQWADWALAHQTPRGNAVTLPVRLPADQVPQHGPSPPLYLVVPVYSFIRDRKPDRWTLLTCGLIGHRVGPRQVRYAYALRWRAEDAKRFLGQVWHVERFLTRSFVALERMLWCVVLASGFLARLQGRERRMCRQLETGVPYWDKPYKLPGYRMARGLQAIAGQAGYLALPNNA